MEETKFKLAFAEYLNGREALPDWDQMLPDEIYANIESEEDFFHFLDFLQKNMDHEKYFEFGVEDTETFIRRLANYKNDVDIVEHAKSKGLHSPFSRLAYMIIIALGN